MTAQSKPGPVKQGTASCPRQRGFSLMEVLVAVFVLSVGITSIVGLQFTAKRSNFEAIQRTTASAVASEVIERMRANPTQLYDYNASGGGVTLSGTPAATITPNCTGAAADCNPADMAAFDLWEIHRALVGVSEVLGGANVGGLTSPVACITGPAPLAGPVAASGTYRVVIAWRGLTQLPSPTAITTCGEGLGLYDDPESAATDVYRRVLVLDTFIAPTL